MNSFPVHAKAFNTKNSLMYVGQDWTYEFQRIGKIEKVTYSNPKVVSGNFSSNELRLKTKSAGKTTITVKGTYYTYTIILSMMLIYQNAH